MQNGKIRIKLKNNLIFDFTEELSLLWTFFTLSPSIPNSSVLAQTIVSNFMDALISRDTIIYENNRHDRVLGIYDTLYSFDGEYAKRYTDTDTGIDLYEIIDSAMINIYYKVNSFGLYVNDYFPYTMIFNNRINEDNYFVNTIVLFEKDSFIIDTINAISDYTQISAY